MSNRTYGREEQEKLARLIREGVAVQQDIDDLKESLKDTIKQTAEELDVKVSLINKAIRIAKNGDWDKHQDEFEELSGLVSIASGRNGGE